MAERSDDLKQHQKEIGETVYAPEPGINIPQEDLSLGSMSDQANEDLLERGLGRSGTMMEKTRYRGREIGGSIVDAVKDHPFASALIGLGLGWLMMGRPNPKRVFVESRGYEPSGRYYESSGRYWVDEPESRYWLQGGELPEDIYQSGFEYSGRGEQRLHGYYGTGGTGEIMEKVREKASSAKERAGHLAEQTRETVRSYSTKAAHKARELKEKVESSSSSSAGHMASTLKEKADYYSAEVSQKAGELKEKARYYGSEASYQARRMKSGFWSTLETNPMSLGFAVLTLGALFGFAIPETRREDELMGETRDQLLEKARETGRETLQKAEHVVEEAGRAAKEEAQRQHLTPEDTRHKMERVAEEAKDAAARETRKEGLSE